MSYKVYKSQNYFVVHDNATSVDVIRQVRDLVRWEKKGTLYSFYYNTPNLTTVGNSIIRLGSVYEFSDLVDSTGTAWASQALLDLYLEQWTGHICCNTAGEDALYDVQNTDGTSLRTGAIPSGEITAIEIPDISFTDSNGTVSSVPAGVDIVASACATPTPRSTATLMKTGQTTSYRTGDDGDIEAGRPTDFLTLDSAPLHNDGSATLNTTTNRFTDILGGQTYATAIVLDWSTWNGTTLTGYQKNLNSNVSWGVAIDSALLISLGIFTSGWRLTNITELFNIINWSISLGLNYPPFNHNAGFTFHQSTTQPWNTGFCLYYASDTGSFITSGKSTTSNWKASRTFSLSTSNTLT